MKSLAASLLIFFLALTSRAATGGITSPGGNITVSGSSSNYPVIAVGHAVVTNGLHVGGTASNRAVNAFYFADSPGGGSASFIARDPDVQLGMSTAQSGIFITNTAFGTLYIWGGFNGAVFSASLSPTGSVFAGTVDAPSVVAGGVSMRDIMLTPASNLTNYTLTATNAEWTLNMTNQVRFTLLAGGVSGIKQFPCVTLTNFSGSAQSITFTNTWVPYGSFTNSVADGKTARCCFEVEGSNVRYSLIVSP